MITDLVPTGSKPVCADYSKVDLKGNILVPGGVNTHEHGLGGIYEGKRTLMNCTEGIWVPETRTTGRWLDSEEHIDTAIQQAAIGHAKRGATTLFLTSMATTPQKLAYFVARTSDYCKSPTRAVPNIRGIYCEGQFLAKDPAYAGAQSLDHFMDPKIENFDRFFADHRYLRTVGIAAEYVDRPEVVELLRHIRELKTADGNGIFVGVGHSGARKDQVITILKESQRMMYIHLGNGPNGSNYKEGLGQVMQSIPQAIVTAEEFGYHLNAEQIVDGLHINSAFRAWIHHEFGNGFIGIGDNIGAFPAYEPMDVTEFWMGTKQGMVSQKDGRALWVRNGEGQALFGSRLVFDQALLNQVRCWMTPNLEGSNGIYSEVSGTPVFASPLGFRDALSLGLDELCTNPADAYGLADVGRIAVGKRADFVAFEAKNTNDPVSLELILKKVYISGVEVN